MSASDEPRKTSPRRSPLLLRSALALLAGMLAGMVYLYGNRQDGKSAGPPVNSPGTVPAETPVSVAQPFDAVKARAAARTWFSACSGGLEYGGMYMPSAEIDRIESLTSAELREWLDEGRKGGVVYALMDPLMERWGEVDQPAFVAWIEMLKCQPYPQPGMGSFADLNPPWVTLALGILQRLDPETKVTGNIVFMPVGTNVTSLPDRRPPDEPPVQAKPDLAALSADDAMRWLARHHGSMDELKQIADRMAMTDFRAALAWAKGIPRHVPERQVALKSVLLKGSEDGPWLLENIHLLERAEDIVHALDNGSAFHGTEEKRGLLTAWALSRTNAMERRAGLIILAARAGDMETGQAVLLFGRLTDRTERTRFLQAMVAGQRDSDGWEKLLPLIAAEPGNGNEPAGAGVAATHLAEKRSVREAIIWAETLPADGRRTAALAAAYTVWIRQDPAAAEIAALELPTGDARTTVLVSLAAAKGERYPARALEWAQTLEVEARISILPRLAESLAPHHAAEARAEAVQLLTTQPAAANDEAFRNAMKTLLPDARTPAGRAAAMQWIGQIPASGLRDQLVTDLKAQAGRSEKVARWLDGQKQAP